MKYTIIKCTAEATDFDKAMDKLEIADGGNIFLEFDNEKEAMAAFDEINCDTYEFEDHGMHYYHVESYELIEEDEDGNIDTLEYKTH